MRITIGYTDDTGDSAANLQLSQERADNVMAELVRQGIDSARMSAKGYGAENPIGVTDKPNTA